jgi:hydroxyacylglutathione hydrolase
MSIPPTPFTPDLWVAQSDYFLTNSGIFLSEGQALLIDPCLRRGEIDAIADFVRAQGAAPRWLVLTHSHWDHVLGPERFPGVRTIAQARYPDVVRRDGAAIAAQVVKWEAEAGQTRAGGFGVPLPDETFEAEHTLALGRLALRLLHVPGHAPDQLAVYEPVRGCLWSSDILSDVEIPFVSDNLAAFERSLAALADYDLRRLVPGHGHPSADPAEIQTRLSEDRAYLAELRQRVARSIERGQTLDRTIAACADMRFRRPAENAEPHRLNVESVYWELGGPVDRSQTGWQ